MIMIIIINVQDAGREGRAKKNRSIIPQVGEISLGFLCTTCPISS